MTDFCVEFVNGWVIPQKDTTKEESIGARESRIRTAIYKTINPPKTDSEMYAIPSGGCVDCGWYINEIFEGYAIAENSGKFYRFNYSDDDGKVIVWEPVEVVKVWQECVVEDEEDYWDELG